MVGRASVPYESPIPQGGGEPCGLEGCDGQYQWVSTNDIVGREVLACHKCGNRNVGRGDCDALDMFFRSTYDPLAGLPEIH
eukprot:g65953.t1